MPKDWVGNGNSIFKTLGASNHTEKEGEQNDYYATEPKAIDILVSVETLNPTVWECACGGGDLSKRLEEKGFNVISTDLIDRGYGEVENFLTSNRQGNFDIVTNPPYKYALEFVKHSLDLISEGNKVCMFLKLQFLEGKERRKFFDNNPPKVVYVSSSRLKCAKNGDFNCYSSSAVAYCWFVWQKGYKGETIIKWIN